MEPEIGSSDHLPELSDFMDEPACIPSANISFLDGVS